MNRTQRIIVLVLGLIDLVVIGVMFVVVMSSMMSRQTTITPVPTRVARATAISIPTWTLTAAPTTQPTELPRPTRTPEPTRTPFPTRTPLPTPTPTPLPPVELLNAEFDLIMPNRIPGWEWDADINWRSGEPYDPQYSYAEPMFTMADDPARRINGSTLKIETGPWLKFRAWMYQTVTVTAGSSVYFQVKANAFSSIDKLIMRAGIDPGGRAGCAGARWGEKIISQADGIVTIASPRVAVGATNRVTVCIFAEPTYPDTNNAAFFDQAELIVRSP